MIQRRSFLIAAVTALPLGAIASPVNIDHSFKVSPVDQGNANLCWLASAAMLISASRGVPVTMTQLASELGGIWKSMYDAKSEITADRVVPFAKALKVRTDGLKSMTTDGWAKLLASGPVLLLGYTPRAVMGHAVLLAGLKGNTVDYAGMNAIVVDPNGAKTITTSFKNLIEFYEGAAAANIPQLMYL